MGGEDCYLLTKSSTVGLFKKLFHQLSKQTQTQTRQEPPTIPESFRRLQRTLLQEVFEFVENFLIFAKRKLNCYETKGY